MDRRYEISAACAIAMMAFANGATAQITGAIWRVAQVEGVTVPDVGKTRFVMAGDGTLSTTVGCNSMRGQATVKDTAVTIGALAATRMACDPALMDLEVRYARALSAVRSYVAEGRTLRLLSADGAVLVSLTEP